MPDRVRRAALVEPNGEVLWPFEIAADAIKELAENHYVVLGLDARERSDKGLQTEILLSAFHSSSGHDATDIGQASQEALHAIDRAEAITGWTKANILITWQPH